MNILGNSKVNFFGIFWSHIDYSRTIFRTSHNENYPFPVPSNGSVERKMGMILTEDQKAFLISILQYSDFSVVDEWLNMSVFEKRFNPRISLNLRV